MDSRVAGYITEVLFEIQRQSTLEENDEMNEEEKPALPKIYDDEEMETQSPLCSDSFDPNQDESTTEAVNGTASTIGVVDESCASNGNCSPTAAARKRHNSANSAYNESPEPIMLEEKHATANNPPPAKKTASAEVKERLRNNILKHDEKYCDDRGNRLVNGLSNSIHKMNGTSVASDASSVATLSSAPSSTATAPSPGSMTIVA